MNEEIKQANDIIYDLYKLYIPLELEYHKIFHKTDPYSMMVEKSQKSAMKRAISASLIYADMIFELSRVGEKNERTNNRSD